MLIDGRTMVAMDIAEQLNTHPMSEVSIYDDKLILTDTGMKISKAIQITKKENCFYLIIAESIAGANYLWLINGDHMIQSNLYDATKFTTRKLAEKRLNIVKEIFKEYKCDIISIDKRVFGRGVRHVIDFEPGYISTGELNAFDDNQKKYIRRMYAEKPNGFFESPKQALCFYDEMYRAEEEARKKQLDNELEEIWKHRHG